MLALKTVIAAADSIPTLVFDEVDVGVGAGRAAQLARSCAHCRTSGKSWSSLTCRRLQGLPTSTFVFASRWPAGGRFQSSMNSMMLSVWKNLPPCSMASR